MPTLKEILESIDKILPHSNSIDQSTEQETSSDSLKSMGKKIPPYFHYVLDSFQTKDEEKKKDTASNLLELVLYAQGKLKHEKKALIWLSSGKVPQSSFESLTSMTQFRNKCEDLFKANENLKTLHKDKDENDGKIKQDPNSKKFNTKAEKIDTKLSEAEVRYELKLADFIDSLESLILGIGSEKL